jgi:type I restriction enzyme S subunit
MKKTWETKTLGEVCEVFADGDWVESKDQSSEGIRLIQTGNVGEGVFKDRSEKARYISEATFQRLRCTEIVEGDCLVSRLPDPVGRSCILPYTGERMITAVDCTILRFNPKQLLPTFFNKWENSKNLLTFEKWLLVSHIADSSDWHITPEFWLQKYHTLCFLCCPSPTKISP